MTSINTGGPAFPVAVPVDFQFAHEGIPARDYFAAKAMSGWLASFGPDEAVKAKNVAEFAYEIADAMLRAREVRP